MKNNLTIKILFAIGLLIPCRSYALFEERQEHIWNEINSEINNSYPLIQNHEKDFKVLHNIDWRKQDIRQISSSIANVMSLINKIETLKNKEAKSCSLFLLRNKLKFSFRQTHPKANQFVELFKKHGAKLKEIRVSESREWALDINYESTLENEFKQTKCSFYYELYSLFGEVWRISSDNKFRLAHGETIPLRDEADSKTRLLKESKYLNKREDELLKIAYANVVLNKWDECGIFDPTKEQLKAYNERIYTKAKEIEKFKKVLKPFLQNRHLKDQTLDILQGIKTKRPFFYNKNGKIMPQGQYCRPWDI